MNQQRFLVYFSTGPLPDPVPTLTSKDDSRICPLCGRFEPTHENLGWLCSDCFCAQLNALMLNNPDPYRLGFDAARRIVMGTRWKDGEKIDYRAVLQIPDDMPVRTPETMAEIRKTYWATRVVPKEGNRKRFHPVIGTLTKKRKTPPPPPVWVVDEDREEYILGNGVRWNKTGIPLEATSEEGVWRLRLPVNADETERNIGFPCKGYRPKWYRNCMGVIEYKGVRLDTSTEEYKASLAKVLNSLNKKERCIMSFLRCTAIHSKKYMDKYKTKRTRRIPE